MFRKTKIIYELTNELSYFTCFYFDAIVKEKNYRTKYGIATESIGFYHDGSKIKEYTFNNGKCYSFMVNETGLLHIKLKNISELR